MTDTVERELSDDELIEAVLRRQVSRIGLKLTQEIFVFGVRYGPGKYLLSRQTTLTKIGEDAW